MSSEQEGRVQLRQLSPADYPRVVEIQQACYPGVEPYSETNFQQQLARFAEGQFGIELDGELVATSSCLIVAREDWIGEHTFEDVSAGDSIASHDPDGDALYGIDIAVDPAHRGQRFGHRIYEYRKELVRHLNLKSMLIAGRLPGLFEHPGVTPEDYVRSIVRKERVDRTLTAQLAQGFIIQRVLRNYLPNDRESRGCAVLMEWINAEWFPDEVSVRSHARVAAVQYRMRPVDSFEQFIDHCTYYADLAAEYRSDFLLFPELLTNQLIPLVPNVRPGQRVRELDAFTERYIKEFSRLAIRFNLNIIGGSHLLVEDGRLYNVSFVFHRDGRVDRQYKLHITPAEARWWGVAPGDRLEVFDTDCGKIAVNICYDVEFPELARIAKAKGANILFVPYNTDLPSGHTRVRVCSQARCIENNIYVVLSGMCGGLPAADWAEIHFARSAILTPSDVNFPRDGVAAEASDNIETMLVSDLDYALLRKIQRQGTVRTWTDRRRDYYSVQWQDDDGTHTVE